MPRLEMSIAWNLIYIKNQEIDVKKGNKGKEKLIRFMNKENWKQIFKSNQNCCKLTLK